MSKFMFMVLNVVIDITNNMDGLVMFVIAEFDFA